MPLLHSGRVRLLFLYVRPSGVSRTTLSWVCHFSGFRYLTASCWSRFAILPLFPVRDALPRPPMPLRHFLPGPLRSPPLRSAGMKRWVGHPTMAAHSCLNRPSRLVHVFKRPRHLTARHRSLDWSLAAPIVSASVAPLDTSSGSAMTSVSSGAGSFLSSRQACVTPSQASVASPRWSHT
jgi:hypothetical protein